MVVIGVDRSNQADAASVGGKRRQQGEGLELVAHRIAARFRTLLRRAANEIGHEEGIELRRLRQPHGIDVPVQIRTAIVSGTGVAPGGSVVAKALNKNIQRQLTWFRAHVLPINP